MVKKTMKKKLTDIDKASRRALAELSRLVRKADFNNSWGEKKWCQKSIWILTNLTRDMSRWGLYADCMICDQLTPDGDCSENNLKKFNGDKENKKTVDNNLKTVKEVLSNDDDGLPARCPTFRRREGFDLRQKYENWKRAHNQKWYMWVVRKMWEAQSNASSVSLSLSERGRQPAKKLHSLVNVHNGR